MTANVTANASWSRNGTITNQSNEDSNNDINQKNALVIAIIIRNGWYAIVNINIEKGIPYAIKVHPVHSIIVII